MLKVCYNSHDGSIVTQKPSQSSSLARVELERAKVDIARIILG